MHTATIGRNYETTLRLINDPRSEWFIPSPSAEMDLATLQKNAAALLAQTEHWSNTMAGANRKSLENLGKILDNQLAKLDQYNAILEQRSAAAAGQQNNPGLVSTPETPAAESGLSPWILVAGAALLAFLYLNRKG